MSWSKQVWDQLKNKSPDDLITALLRDGWQLDVVGKHKSGGSSRIYRHPDGRMVVIHYHRHKTYGEKLLKGLLEDIGWTEEDMRRLKLIA
ncbi:MAG: type II toxin-antitoxin system HicA family toxin [Chloroflexi bacterium]|nr:type II toxin-antitoxin system HicA family toxin [Chloroflexota bacterium]